MGAREILSTSNPVQCRFFGTPSARASLPAVYSQLHSPRTTPTPCRDLFPGYEEELGFLDISLRERDSLR